MKKLYEKCITLETIYNGMKYFTSWPISQFNVRSQRYDVFSKGHSNIWGEKCKIDDFSEVVSAASYHCFTPKID